MNKNTANLAMNYGDEPKDIEVIRRKRKVVLEAYVQTGYEQYTRMYKYVEIEFPDDGNDWHVVGEMI